MRSTIKPRHVFGALVLIAQAPILAAFVAGWLISGLIYAIALGVEPARGHGRDWRHGSASRVLSPRRSVTSAAFARAAPVIGSR